MRFFKSRLFVASLATAFVLSLTAVAVGLGANGLLFSNAEAVASEIAGEISPKSVEKVEEFDSVPLANQLVSTNVTNNEVAKSDDLTEKVLVNELVSAKATTTRLALKPQAEFMDLESLRIENSTRTHQEVQNSIIDVLTKVAGYYYNPATENLYYPDGTVDPYGAKTSVHLLYFDAGIKTTLLDRTITTWQLMSVKRDDQGVPVVARLNLVYTLTEFSNGTSTHILSGGNNTAGGTTYYSEPTYLYSLLTTDGDVKDTLSGILGDKYDRFVEDIAAQNTGMLYTGFVCDLDNVCFTTDINAPIQRGAGFAELYDGAAAVATMIYDTFRLKFDYSGVRWMLQPWKGQYGLLCGAEIGMYYVPDEFEANEDFYDYFPSNNFWKDTLGFYKCAEDPYLLNMSFDLYRHDYEYGKELVISTGIKEHWWLTTFRLGDITNFNQLTMDAYLKFENSYQGTVEYHTGEDEAYSDEFFYSFVEAILTKDEDGNHTYVEYEQNSSIFEKIFGSNNKELRLYVYEINFTDKSIRFVWGNPDNLPNKDANGNPCDFIPASHRDDNIAYSNFLIRDEENNVVAISEAYFVEGMDNSVPEDLRNLINSIRGLS